MNSSKEEDVLETLVRQSLEMLRRGPKSLSMCMEIIANTNDIEIETPLKQLETRLLLKAPNDPALNALAFRVHDWDHQEINNWTGQTDPHSLARREVIIELLELQPSMAEALNAAIPLFTLAERSTVIALAHKPWYQEQLAKSNNFYWNAYRNQLVKGGWTQSAVDILHESTGDVVSRLSEPTRSEIYQVKGLVVGYVQSGKTAHFAGVIAKAADSGYRLVIVLAGTLNILRRQTQRRLDKDLLGQELLAGSEYVLSSDWQDFVRHGSLPSNLNAFDWERLTDIEDDYKPLGARLGALKFNKVYPSEPFNTAKNLRAAPARLIVVKKLPQIIKDLAKDLATLRKQGNKLEQIPTLIIDDESDQASVNTIDTSKPGKEDERTSTNASIIELLKTLDRAQYVGYTATPFANVFTDPTDMEQLFPKDFIVTLPRPKDYMGVSNFFDLDADVDDEKGPNETAYVRDVAGSDDEITNLPRAIDSFVLAGALKLFRSATDPTKYRYKHHTMLVHHSSARIVHKAQADQVQALFESAHFTSQRTRPRLEGLWKSDFNKFKNSALPNPESFDDLVPFIGQSMAKIKSGKPVLIVNGDDDNKDDTPDFESGEVWAILVGGAKLSRGYTVEGLTTTYYRRITNAADTLMQMGRWFGFRPGYTDLVRWFIGRNEAKGKSGKKTVDLYEQFGAICRDEEAFRQELTRYAGEGNIKPAQVPPLVYSHLPSLKPTAGNKMYNAVLKFKNLGGKWVEKTTVSDSEAQVNSELAEKLLTAISLEPSNISFDDAEQISFDAFCGIATRTQVRDFLTNFQWTAGTTPLQYELEYESGKNGSPCIDDWLVMCPQTAGFGVPWENSALPPMTVVRRSRTESGSGRFKVFSEPAHRRAAEMVCSSLELSNPTSTLNSYRNRRRAVLLMYRVVPRNETDSPISIGFGIRFPESNIQHTVMWSVHDPAQTDAIVVTIP